MKKPRFLAAFLIFNFAFLIGLQAQDTASAPAPTSDDVSAIFQLFSGKYGWFAALVSLMGTLRLFLKPIFAVLETTVAADPAKSKALAEFEGGPIFKVIAWLLDHLASIKLKPLAVQLTTPAAVMVIATFAGSGLLAGCAALAPGADPIVVRTEQFETQAHDSFELIVSTDNANRGFWITNAPAFHKFAETLRAPITIDGTNTLPQADAWIQSLDNVKQDYKTGRATSNALVTAIITLQGAYNEATNYAGQITAAK